MRNSQLSKKQVNKDVFESFVKSYPSKLETDVAAMFDPPIKSYNDFTTGKTWPESVVAFIELDDGRAKNGDIYYLLVP